MEYVGNCVGSTAAQCARLMEGAKRFSYKKLCKLIKEEYPDLYDSLCLDFFNPWHHKTRQTPTHYILVHSAIEYFFYKEP